MWQKRPCPPSSDLKRLIDGTLPASEQKAIDRHLWFCGSCQELVESLTYDEDGSPRSISCPDHAVLKRHLDGKVSVHAQEAIEHHLESCSSCQAIVEAIESGEEIEPPPNKCPERTVLARLLDGSLGDRERTAIEHHIDSCNTCQAELDTLASSDAAWPRQVRNLGRGHNVESPGLKRVIGVHKHQLHPDEAVTGGMPTAPEEILAFLDPPESPDHLGKLGPYRVVQVLGQGGMGMVLKAFDPALHRSVAIKVLAPQLATTSSARQRFAREARAAAAIRNEHVVAIHSVDDWKGLPYLVMEFIPGASLQERIDRTAPLDLNSILRIGMQAAAGLAAAHAQGLVHRDIKPSNILLENCVERVKISDFGLARAVDDASLTQSGVVAGTPLFMAPEQARSETIDHRADLFSLGAVLYAMCTGRSPFRAPTTLAVLRRVCDETPRLVREVNRDIPDWLAAIIDRLLAKEPAKRYQDASEVAALLGRHLARRQESPASDAERTKPFAPPALEDVGPVKRSGGRRRMVQLACYLVVILAGLIVLTEVTGATRIIDSLARLFQPRVGGAQLVVHVTDPSVQFSINGSVHHRGPGYFDHSFPGETSGFVVETFKEGRKVSGMHFSAKPNLGIELEIGGDGQITVEYDGPIRAPKPRREYFYPRNHPGHPTDPVLRGDSPIHATDSIPSGLDSRPLDTKKGLHADARWNAAVVGEASARASLEKAIASRDLARVKFERMKALGEQSAVEAKLVDEAGLHLTVAESDVLVAKADVALAEAKRKQVEVAYGRERIQKLLDSIKRTARDPDNEPATREYKRRAVELSQKERELTRDAAAAELERAMANLAKATAKASFHKKQFDRIRQLDELHAVEKRIVQEIQAKLGNAEADQRAAQAILSAAQARLKGAEENLKVRKDP
jgi:serine/threonine protein kinase